MVQIFRVESKSMIRRFIEFPYMHYAKNPYWIPPFFKDEKDFHKLISKGDYSEMDTVRYIAMADNRVVGRIMGVINYTYNAYVRIKIRCP